MTVEVDPHTLLYGPAQPLRRRPRAPGWAAPRLLGSSIAQSQALAFGHPDGVDIAFVEASQIIVHRDGHESKEEIGCLPGKAFSEDGYVRGGDGVHYFTWSRIDESGFSMASASHGGHIITHLRSKTRFSLQPSDEGCYAIWASGIREEDCSPSGFAALQCEHFHAGRVDDSLTIDVAPTTALGPACAGDGWAAWAFLNRDDRWEISVSRVTPGAPGSSRHSFLAPGKISQLRVSERNGGPCVCWTDSDTGNFFFADPGGTQMVGHGLPAWKVLSSGEVVFAWSDWLSSESLIFASLRDAGGRTELDSVQGALPLRGQIGRPVVGCGPDGAARICWRSTQDGQASIYSQSVCEGIPEMPTRLPGSWTGGRVHISQPVAVEKRMVLPVIHSTPAALFAWTQDLT